MNKTDDINTLHCILSTDVHEDFTIFNFKKVPFLDFFKDNLENKQGTVCMSTLWRKVKEWEDYDFLSEIKECFNGKEEIDIRVFLSLWNRAHLPEGQREEGEMKGNESMKEDNDDSNKHANNMNMNTANAEENRENEGQKNSNDIHRKESDRGIDNDWTASRPRTKNNEQMPSDLNLLSQDFALKGNDTRGNAEFNSSQKEAQITRKPETNPEPRNSNKFSSLDSLVRPCNEFIIPQPQKSQTRKVTKSFINGTTTAASPAANAKTSSLISRLSPSNQRYLNSTLNSKTAPDVWVYPVNTKKENRFKPTVTSGLQSTMILNNNNNNNNNPGKIRTNERDYLYELMKGSEGSKKNLQNIKNKIYNVSNRTQVINVGKHKQSPSQINDLYSFKINSSYNNSYTLPKQSFKDLLHKEQKQWMSNNDPSFLAFQSNNYDLKNPKEKQLYVEDFKRALKQISSNKGDRKEKSEKEFVFDQVNQRWQELLNKTKDFRDDHAHTCGNENWNEKENENERDNHESFNRLERNDPSTWDQGGRLEDLEVTDNENEDNKGEGNEGE